MSLFQIVLTIPTIRGEHVIHGNLTAVSFHGGSVDTCLTGCNKYSTMYSLIAKGYLESHLIIGLKIRSI